MGLAAEARAAEEERLAAEAKAAEEARLAAEAKQTLYYREHSLAAFGILQENSAQPVHEIGQLRKQARGALLQGAQLRETLAVRRPQQLAGE